MGASKGQVPIKKPRPSACQKQTVENGTTGSQKSKRKSSLKKLTALLRKKDSDKKRENVEEKLQDNLAIVRPLGNVELQDRKKGEQNIYQEEKEVVYDVPKPMETAIVIEAEQSEEDAQYVNVDIKRESNSVNTADYLGDTNNTEVIDEESQASRSLHPDYNSDANEQNKNNELVEEDRQGTLDDENKDSENEVVYENSPTKEMVDDEKEEETDDRKEEANEKEEEDREKNAKEEEEEEEGEGEDSRELPEEWGVKPTRRSIILPENYPDAPQTRTSIV